MFNLLKVIIIIVVLFFVYSFLQGYIAVGGDPLSQSPPLLQINETRLSGSPSPYKGRVSFSTHTATTKNPKEEYITINADIDNTEAISLSGWSIESIVSKTKVYLPPATLLLKMAKKNDVRPVFLAPGEYAILHSGVSPIADTATSFHTNTCIGYVGAQNSFIPKLKSACNNPSAILPPTPQNITTYGAECIEFFTGARACTSYTNEMPAHLLPACRELITRKLTYHSCLRESLEKYGYDIYDNGGWYLYLNHTAEIWRNTYEALRLLDADGLVVDVLKY